ncbi:tetratricopeptide repeat protein [Novosphingobium decolorationis]|uniref:Tetratricopeptide repeat protein n=1 Tax=Novosphingobium decolorationis TaxID=2698673 RepID=A0ABX8EEE0_9SPHN|nr:tetratricopeptide repeat protein [Novosphingobium decolorationis]QVM86285.1 tetratricopeptide repeat protein [Novosphingobium decolorationis]
MGLNIEEQKAAERFRKEVAEPSMTQLVILDFWAEWCGPCKALTPVLEKVAAEYADKGVVLAKINVDEEQFIASQFQVRSIPTVYAMFQGQPVADLTQARSESQLKATLDKLLEQLPVQPGGQPPKPDIAPHLAMAEEALAAGDAEQAAGVFMQILQVVPDSAEAASGLIRALVAADRLEEAAQMLETLPVELSSDPQIERARKALELAKDKPDDGELAALRSAAETNPSDLEAQFSFANAAFAAGERDIAAETLLKMVAIDREWNDSAARTKLLEIFEAVGLEDPWVSATRRKLSTILFG